MCWRSRTKSSFSGQVCQQGGSVGVQVVEVSACWLWLISPQCTTRTEAAGGGEWQIRFGGIWCWLDRGNQEIPLDGWLPLTYATNTSPATYMARGGNIFQLGDQRSENFDQRLMDSGGRLSIAMAIFLRVVNLQQNWYWVSYAGSDFLFFAYPFLSISHFIGKMIYYHHYQKEWFVIYSLDDCI